MFIITDGRSKNRADTKQETRDNITEWCTKRQAKGLILTIKDCSEALGYHRNTVSAHFKEIKKEQANGRH